tara:strand:+ start:112 stop:468 length:357 start_codon:yes stop_codon:yes gene_type:complete
MSSTRKVNNYDDYVIEQNANLKTNQYLTTVEYGIPSTTHFPGEGLLQGQVAPTKISANYCDIESSLRGIGSSNLVEPQKPVKPIIYNPKSLDTTDYKTPVIMPDPFTLLANQRPNIQN